VKEPNKFHIYETEKITRIASDAAEYIELFGSGCSQLEFVDIRLVYYPNN